MSALNTGALHPLASSGASTDKRVYEPSMEEILASIRRIIADDQSLPGRGAAEQDEPPRAAPTSVAPPRVEPPRVEPPVELRRTPAPQELFGSPRREPVDGSPRSGEHAPDPVAPVPTPVDFERAEPAGPSSAGPQAAPPAHGTIAAPQYAMPDRAAFADVEIVPRPAPSISPETLRADARDEVDESREVPPRAAAPRASVAEAARPDITEPDNTEPDLPIEPPAAQAADASSLFSAATDSSVAAAFNLLAASRLADNSDEIMNLVRDTIRPLLRNWLDDNLPSMVERMVRAEIERVARGGR